MPPRIRPLSSDEIPASLRDLPAFKRSGEAEPFNIYRTFAHHPVMVENWLKFADPLRFCARLSDRHREIAILRTAVNCECAYEWAQHVPYAVRAGMTTEEIELIKQPGAEVRWNPDDRAVVSAADELHARSDISDETWTALSEVFDDQQMIELLLLVGQYHQVAFLVKAARVDIDRQLTDSLKESH
jgi:4-carboxymuconolactone decarboxylase